MAPEKNNPDTSNEPSWDLKGPVGNNDPAQKDQSANSQPAQPRADDLANLALPGEKLHDEVPASAASPSPIVSPTPLPMGGASGGKRKKIVFIVLGIILLLLLAGAGTAFALYNKPDRVLGDALSNAFLADNVSFKGDSKSKSEGGDTSAEFSGQKNNVNEFAFNVDIKGNINPMAFKLSADVVSSNEGDLYVKIGNAREIIQNVSGLAGGGQLDKVIELVDDKWVKVSASELNKNSKDKVNLQQCVTKVREEIKRNNQLSNELRNVYSKNAFLIIDKTLQSEAIGGVDSLHYKLRIDEAKTKSFIVDLKQTEVFKKVQNCDKDFTLDENDITESIKDASANNIEVWVSRWSHDFTRIKIEGKDVNEGSSFVFNVEPKFNIPVTVTIPKDSTPLKKVQQEFQRAYGFDDSASLEGSVQGAFRQR